MTDNKPWKCPLCGEMTAGYGHNGRPVIKAQVCDQCNLNQVVPKRLESILFNNAQLEKNDD